MRSICKTEVQSSAVSRIVCAQAADNLPLYGVCCYMEEVVHRPPTILRTSGGPSPPLSRYLVAAPRCYCFLTHQPFFSLHFKVARWHQSSSLVCLGTDVAICKGATAHLQGVGGEGSMIWYQSGGTSQYARACMALCRCCT